MIEVFDTNAGCAQCHVINGEVEEVEDLNTKDGRYFLALTRISLGWIFLWGFLDKAFGLGFTTPKDSSWINGGNPIYGYLNYGTSGPLQGTFQTLSGNIFCQWLFMLGLLGIGLSLFFGIGTKIAAYSAFILLGLMYFSSPPFIAEGSHNPLVDDHVVYAFLALYIGLSNQRHSLSLYNFWSKQPIVHKYPSLR